MKKVIQQLNFIGSFRFGFSLRTKLFSNAGYAAKLHKMPRNLTFVVQFAYCSIGPKIIFVFLSNFRDKKQLFEKLRKLFGKSRATCECWLHTCDACVITT